MQGGQRPLELILARNLLTSLSTPAFLVAADGALLFYNEAAGALLGVSFEDAGRMEPAEWTAAYGPFDDAGNPFEVGEMQLTDTLRHGRPAHSRFQIRSAGGEDHKIEAAAVPIQGAGAESSGAMIFFWESPGNNGSEVGAKEAGR